MTDRTLRTVADLDALHFRESDGLVPVVAQDAHSGDVLMTAYANREALTASIETGALHFWSRSRAALWRKGETSGNTLQVASLHTDCDADAVLAVVHPAGPACHTGEQTCFGSDAGPTLSRLAATIAERAAQRPEGSYTTRLLDEPNLRVKKLGEENAELVVALATGNAEGVTEEAADVVYHLLVAAQAVGVTLSDVVARLDDRMG